jgi:transposase
VSGEFWLSDRQWRRLAPLLPNKPRGVPRVDDRRVISGIVHVLRSVAAGPMSQLPTAHARPSTIASYAGRPGRLAGRVQGAGGHRRAARRDAARQHPREGAPLRHGRQRGQRRQALGISCGRRTTKIHALSDGLGRPLAFLLTPGQAADCRAAEALLQSLPPNTLVMADRAYDTDTVRDQIQARGVVPVQGSALNPVQAKPALEALLQPNPLPRPQRD